MKLQPYPKDNDSVKRRQVMFDREKYKRAAPRDIAYKMMRMRGIAPSWTANTGWRRTAWKGRHTAAG